MVLRSGTHFEEKWEFESPQLAGCIQNCEYSHVLLMLRTVPLASTATLLIVDVAGWHSSPKLAVPENIVLLKLPPYAPELNPAETIWEYLRGNTLSFQVWETYDAIVDACCDAWNGLMRVPAIIRSIASREWAQVRT